MRKYETKERTIIILCTPESDNYTGCAECAYGDDDEVTCINRGCIHAITLRDCFTTTKGVTNLEKIRQMSKEELYDFYCSNPCDVCISLSEKIAVKLVSRDLWRGLIGRIRMTNLERIHSLDGYDKA